MAILIYILKLFIQLDYKWTVIAFAVRSIGFFLFFSLEFFSSSLSFFGALDFIDEWVVYYLYYLL